VTPSNVYRPSQVRATVIPLALFAAGGAFFFFSPLRIDHIYGAVFLSAGAVGLLVRALRKPPQLTIEQDALVVGALRVPWSEVDVSEIKDRRRGSMRFPAFTVMVADPKSDTGRRTIEVLQPRWPRFDELYEALRSAAPRKR
jgi:hypothetical protein